LSPDSTSEDPTGATAPLSADVVILGAGPAGLILARACCAEGLTTLVIDPRWSDGWPNTYGLWTDEAEPLGVRPFLSVLFPKTRVWTDDRPIELGRVYGRLDNAAFRAHVIAAAGATGRATWLEGAATGVDETPLGQTVTLRDGRKVRARFVVDASGAQSPFILRPELTPDHALTAQVAYGEIVTLDAPLLEPGEMWLMDYRPLNGDTRTDLPTFLYAQALEPRGGHPCVFLEETVLASRPVAPVTTLETRFRRRLAELGVKVRDVVHVERCVIPMADFRPTFGGPVIPFGAAAGFVNPATGFMLPRTLRQAPFVAQALKAALQDLDRELALRRVWDTVWPADALARDDWYRFGLAALLPLGGDDMRAFFGAFFHLPRNVWQPYFAGTAAPGEIPAIMWQVFDRVPWRIKRALMAATLTQPGAVARLLLGQRGA
jgi:lycopene cyclase-like protein